MSKTTKKYLTVKEFVELAETADNIIIHVKKDGRDRYVCKSPVDDLVWEDGNLTWFDGDGEPDMHGLSEDTILKNIPNHVEDIYTTSCYIEVPK